MSAYITGKKAEGRFSSVSIDTLAPENVKWEHT